MSTATVIVLIIAIAAIGAAVWMYVLRARSRKLQAHFGTEYDHVLAAEGGNRQRAESQLVQRQKRVEKLLLRPLSPEEREQFGQAWRVQQEHFVDDPHAAVGRADELVSEAMRARGFPMGEFEERAADISVEHPMVVEHYRQAHTIALRDRTGGASTEDLRRAMQHYRQLFESVIDYRVSETVQEVQR